MSATLGWAGTLNLTNGPLARSSLFETRDGGRTWTELQVGQQVGFSGVGFSGVGFATAQLGWVAGDAQAFETRDGGSTWRALVLGQAVNRFRFFGASVAFAAGATVYRCPR